GLSDQVIRNFTNTLNLYFKMQLEFLYDLELEFKFFIGAARLFKNLKSRGIVVCRPEVLPMTDRVLNMEGMSDLLLSLKQMEVDWKARLGEVVVPNDVDMAAGNQIMIVTGPNQGGKTVYTRAVGICQVLAQAGLYIPAVSARLSAVDWIYTHF